MAQILVTENIVGPGMDQLRDQFDVAWEPGGWEDTEKLASQLQDIEALVVRNQTQVTDAVIASAPNLKVIGRAGAGLDNIDVEAATRAGIVVTYAPRDNSLSVAELTLGLMISLARGIAAAHHDTRQGGWNRARFTGDELAGKRLGIVGIGRIGTLVAQRARAFDMTLMAHDSYVAADAPHVKELDIELTSLENLLSRADFVTCHVPLSKETHHLFNRDQFQQMKSGAMFINTSRGEIVEETALVEALQTNRLAGAAIDVRSTEPPQPSELELMENVILTPHIAAFTHQAQERVVDTVCRDVSAVLQGKDAIDAFNFPRPIPPA